MTRSRKIWAAVIVFFLIALTASIIMKVDRDKKTNFVTTGPVEQAEEEQRLDPRAIPQKGDGIENVFTRQLVVNPNPFGYKGKHEPKLIKKWAEGESDRLARRFGFIVYKNGKVEKEIRIKGDGGDTAYQLGHENGQVIVRKYSKVGGKFRIKPDFTTFAKEIGKAKFCTDVIGCMQPYEYMHTNKIKSGKEKYSEAKSALHNAVAHGCDHGGDSCHGRAVAGGKEGFEAVYWPRGNKSDRQRQESFPDWEGKSCCSA